MDRLIYKCLGCGAEHSDLASAVKVQFCFKCGADKFETRLPDLETLALKNEALLLVIGGMAQRFGMPMEEVLVNLVEAEKTIRERSEQAPTEARIPGEPPLQVVAEKSPLH